MGRGRKRTRHQDLAHGPRRPGAGRAPGARRCDGRHPRTIPEWATRARRAELPLHADLFDGGLTMPLPKPRQGEGRQEFIGRCMADETMQSEFPDESQRAAVCYRQWRNRGKVMSKTLEKKAIVRPFEVKAVNAEERTFEGLASTWDL